MEAFDHFGCLQRYNFLQKAFGQLVNVFATVPISTLITGYLFACSFCFLFFFFYCYLSSLGHQIQALAVG